jgi:hypothetical protein
MRKIRWLTICEEEGCSHHNDFVALDADLDVIGALFHGEHSGA